ncbi:uncharacterized protein LOC133886354 [Phragmites australis]|uniref:uncharacterized protein LOC133886354 n=1 Tax=Phragmites australis TaxID=29695 RepID=UPI002D788D93|nr:uncharacterized protein LOC133886354 [Phragmites australis]
MNEEHALNNGNSDVAAKKSVDCNEAIDHSQTNIKFLSPSKGCISEFGRSYTPTEILQSSNGYSNEHSPNKEVTQHVADDGTFKKSPDSYHLETNEQCSIAPVGESSPAKSNVDVKADEVPNVDNQLADLILSKLCKLVPEIDTPTILQAKRNLDSVSASIPAPIHPMNKKFKPVHRNTQYTNLFEPNNLFQLLVPEDECCNNNSTNDNSNIQIHNSSSPMKTKDICGQQYHTVVSSQSTKNTFINQAELENEIIDVDLQFDHVSKNQDSHHSGQHTVHSKVPATSFDGRKVSPLYISDCANNSQSTKAAHVSPEVKFICERKFTDRCNELGNVAEQLYNNRINVQQNKCFVTSSKDGPLAKLHSRLNNAKFPMNTSSSTSAIHQFVHVAKVSSPFGTSSDRFPVTQAHIRYYKILCSLAHSQWSGEDAVQFYKTHVTYGSLGESVEPAGLVDNFFISGYCRKFFEDCHPRKSKKHYFFTSVGDCMLRYKTDYDVKTVKKSFLGANSAHKLHLSHKMFFPICSGKHWFLFIVDLRNKLFAFLDSIFEESDGFQIQMRTALINSFKEAWYEHAEVKLDLEDFRIFYPPVPKQDNGYDCGIFVIKYMELWDANCDLTTMFNQFDIPNIRVLLANDIFFSTRNRIPKTLVQSFCSQDPRIFK